MSPLEIKRERGKENNWPTYLRKLWLEMAPFSFIFLTHSTQYFIIIFLSVWWWWWKNIEKDKSLFKRRTTLPGRWSMCSNFSYFLCYCCLLNVFIFIFLVGVFNTKDFLLCYIYVLHCLKCLAMVIATFWFSKGPPFQKQVLTNLGEDFLNSSSVQNCPKIESSFYDNKIFRN